MLHGGDKAALVAEAFVPKPVPAAVSRGDVDLIDGGISAYPRIALSNCPGVAGEVQRHLRILKISHPIRNSKVKQVEDRCDAQSPDFGHGLIGEGPVVAIGAEMDEMVRNGIAQDGDAQVLHEPQVFAPALVMAAFFQQIAADALAVGIGDDRIGALDAGGEGEVPAALPSDISSRFDTLRRGAGFIAREWSLNAVSLQQV